MSRRRLNSIASLIDGFNAGYGMVRDVARDIDLGKVAAAKVEEVPGVSPPPNQAEVDRMTEAGGGYPEAGPINAATGGPKSASKFALLGVTQDAPFTPEQATRARQEAQAGVLEKHGDLEGAGRVRDRIASGELRAFNLGEAKKNSERGDQLFQWQKEDRDRQQRARDEEDDYRRGRRELFANSTFGKSSAAYAKEVEEYQRKQEAYDEAVRRGDAGAIAPTKPLPPSVGPAEMLSDAAKLLLYDAEKGKATPESLMSFGNQMRKTMQEGIIQALRMAHGGAGVDAFVAEFNKQGEQKIDPSMVTDAGFVERGNGLKSRILKIKQPDGSIATIDTLASLDSFQAAGDYFQRATQTFTQQLALRADARAGAAEGRAQANFNAGAGQREAEAAMGEAQAAVVNAKTPEERAAATDRLRLVREGLAAGAPMADDKNAPAEVKLARATLQAGMHKDMAEALRFATSAKGKNPQELRAEIYKEALKSANGNVPRAQKITNESMQFLVPDQGGQAPAAGPGGQPGAGAPAATRPQAAPASESEARAQAEEAVRRGANRDAVNQRLQQMGYQPISGMPMSAQRGGQPAAAPVAAPGAGAGAQPPAAAAPSGPAEPPQAAAFDQARAEVDAAKLQLKSAREVLMRFGSRQRQTDPEGLEAAKRAVAQAEAELAAARGRNAQAQAAYEKAMTAGSYIADAGGGRLR